MRIITIDCGASFVKGALFERDGTLLKQITRQAPAVHQAEDVCRTEQIDRLLPLVRDILLALGHGETRAQLCLANEMHGFLLADAHGNPVTDYLSWQIEYGECAIGEVTAIEALAQEVSKEDLLWTGMPLRAGLPSVNLYYLIHEKKLQNAKGKLFFYTLGDFLLRALSGGEPMTHPTNAAATGLYDLRTGDWNKRLMEVVAPGLDLCLPKIGDSKMEFTVDTLTVVAVPAVGDQQAALLGAGLNDNADLSFNLGTGAQVSRLVAHPEVGATYQIRPYFDGRYIKTIPHLPSGRAVNVYIRFFQDILQHFSNTAMDEEKIWRGLLEAAEKAADSSLEIDLSFFANPVTSRTQGRITHIDEHGLSLEALAYGIFDQMAKNFLWAADLVATDPKEVGLILFSGGIAEKCSLIRDEIRQHYGSEVEYKISHHGTLYGLYCYGRSRFSV